MKHIRTDKDGVIWIEPEFGNRVGIIGVNTLRRVFGDTFDYNAIQYIELNDDVDADQNHETEETSFEFECGARLVFSGESVFVVSPIYLMNPHTGSVDTAGNWKAEGHTQENSNLIAVVKDESGEWIEAE